MFTIATFRKLSKNIVFILIGSIAFSSVNTTYPQAWLKEAYQSVKGSVGGKIGELTSAASKKIQGGLSSVYDRVRKLDRTAVINQLQKQVETLGNKVSYMGNCMIKGTCSTSERAAFVGTAIAVLALTTATVGITLTVAATSKEVESVTKATSQEVQGWGPQQIFQRLSNTIKDFKQSLTSLKQGILTRQLTAGQKKFLYGTAASIAALTTIAVGVGVASYLYAEKKAGERAEQEAAEKAKQAHELMMRTEEEARQGKISQEEVQSQIQALLNQIGEFDDNPITPQELQKESLFKRYFLEKIDVIKGGPQRLRQAFDQIREQVRSGAIKTKEGVIDAYYKAVDFAQNLPTILENAIGVSLEKMNNGYNAIKTALEEFKTSLSNPQALLQNVQWYPSGETFFSSVTSLGGYLLTLDKMSDDAEEAWDKLNIFKIIHAKSLSPEEYIQKKQAFAQREAQLIQKRQDLESQVAALSQSDLSKSKIKSKLADIEKENKTIAEKLEKLNKNRQILAYKENFDRFASPKYWADIYFPELMKRINALQLKTAGKVSEVVMSGLGKVFAGAEFLNKHGGAIGNRLFDTQRLGRGLQALKEELPKLGANLRELLAVTPIILVSELSSREVGESALNAMVKKKARFLREHGEKLKHIVSSLQAVKGRTDPLSQKLKTFSQWFETFKGRIVEEIKTALFKEKAIAKTAKIVRDSVINVVEKQKIAFNEVLTELPYITDKLTEMLPDLGTVFVDLNTSLKGIIGKEFINPQFIQKLAPIINARIPNIHQAVKNIVEGSKNYAASPV